MAMGYASVIAGKRVREGETGLEKFCAKCDDWWPADPEFFWVTKGKLFHCCKACYHENDKRKGRRGAPASRQGGAQ